jgi:hypothetical protein
MELRNNMAWRAKAFIAVNTTTTTTTLTLGFVDGFLIKGAICTT